MKHLFICCFCVALPAILIGQSKYSQTDKEQFVHTYMSLKNSKNDTPEVLDSLRQVHNITAERYQTLLIAAIKNEETAYTENELSFKEAVRELNERSSQRATAAIHSNNGQSLQLYNDMLRRYKTDMEFQHELRPLFLAYFKENK